MQLGGQLILLQGKVCQNTLSPFPLLEGDRSVVLLGQNLIFLRNFLTHFKYSNPQLANVK